MFAGKVKNGMWTRINYCPGRVSGNENRDYSMRLDLEIEIQPGDEYITFFYSFFRLVSRTTKKELVKVDWSLLVSDILSLKINQVGESELSFGY